MNLRLLALHVILDVTDGRSLTDCLKTRGPAIKDQRDRAFVQALCYGVCRFYSRLDLILSYLLKKPLKEKDSDLHGLLIIGLYQLMEMRLSPYAAVSETVKGVIGLKKEWAKGLVNAVLREYIRHQTELNERAQKELEGKFAHPTWWITAIKEAWPTHFESILEANNAHPPFSLRVNRSHYSREAYLAILEKHGYTAQIIPETTTGIILENATPVDTLPGFLAGDVSVQDGAAQLCAHLLAIEPHSRILDACASPGGKLTHILEIEPHLAALIAIEKEEERMQIIQNNLARILGPVAKDKADFLRCICSDALDVKKWWDGIAFDRILLDAPCSASGVIRRHPDIKLLRQPSDLQTLVKKQRELLEALWPLLKPGGILLYATCSIFPIENTQVMHTFLKAHPDAKEEKIENGFGIACDIGRQILPGMHHMDGFYYAKVRKQE